MVNYSFVFWYCNNILPLELIVERTRKFMSLEGFKLALKLLVIGFFIIKLYHISTEAYFDSGSRFNKTYAIENSLSEHIYTTETRANITNDLLEELEKHVDEGDYLLAYDKIPMVNFLTKTKPYMYNSWVWVYDSYTFEKQLWRAEHEINELPIVVQQKFETIRAFSDPDPDYMSETKTETYHYKSGRVKAMNAFLKRNNYNIIWSNSHFNIYKHN